MEDSNGQKGATLQQGGEDPTSDTGKNVASASMGGNGRGNLICPTYGEKAIDFKASKRIYKRFGIKSNTFQALSILWLYLHFMNKAETGATLTAVADWSGFGNGWENKMGYWFGQLIESGAVEKFPYNGGYRYLIARKGLHVLEVWEAERQDIIRDCETRHAAAVEKQARTRENMRLKMSKRDGKGRFNRS